MTLHALLAKHSPFAPSAQQPVDVQRHPQATIADGGNGNGKSNGDGGGGGDAANGDGDGDGHVAGGKEAERQRTLAERGRGGSANGSANGSAGSAAGKSTSQVASPASKARDNRQLQDQLTLEYNPPDPDDFSPAGALMLRQLLTKEASSRLGAGGAVEVKVHPFFCDFDWMALRRGTLRAPFEPAAKDINAGSVADSGGVEGSKQLYATTTLQPEHFKLFKDWDWCDRILVQHEIVEAVSIEGAEANCWSPAYMCGCLG